MAIRGRLITVGIFVLPVCFFLSVISCGQSLSGRGFSPGDPAPSLEGGVWLKGEAVHRFTPGHVYVLDFGGVLCSPCRAFIPHLTALARHYAGRITFLGVYVYENGINREDTVTTVYQDNVRRFVLRMGDRIGYGIVVDGPSQPLGRAWMEAGGYSGLPTTFVVDQQGRMVWAGYPSDLEPVLEKVLANRFDIREGIAQERRRVSLDERIYVSKRNKEYSLALGVVDSLIKVTPMDKSLYYEKFRILLASDEVAAYSFARQAALTTCADSEPTLFYIAREIVQKSALLRQPDGGLVLDLADQALKLSRSEIVSALIYDVKAQAFFLLGKTKQALHAEERAVKVLGTDNYPLIAEIRLYLNDRVAYYRSRIE